MLAKIRSKRTLKSGTGFSKPLDDEPLIPTVSLSVYFHQSRYNVGQDDATSVCKQGIRDVAMEHEEIKSYQKYGCLESKPAVCFYKKSRTLLRSGFLIILL